MSTPVTTSLNTWRPVSRADRITVRARGRVCAHEGCDTILSIYNPAKYCSAHGAEALGRSRRVGLQTAHPVACEHCGETFETRNENRRYCSDRCRMAAFTRRRRAAERVLRRLQQQPDEQTGQRAAQLAKDAA